MAFIENEQRQTVKNYTFLLPVPDIVLNVGGSSVIIFLLVNYKLLNKVLNQ